MKKIVEGITIEYEKQDEALVKLITSKLEKKVPHILEFFGLDGVKDFKIKLWGNLEDYRSYLIPYLEAKNEKYYNWIIQYSGDGNINILPLRLVRETGTHKNMTEDEIASIACHEFVHICQNHVVKEDVDGTYWFWEALATNLGNPESFQWFFTEPDNQVDFGKIKDTKALEEITNTSCYTYAFLVGNYMLKNLSHKKILGYAKNENLLAKDGEAILQKTKDYYKSSEDKKVKLR